MLEIKGAEEAYHADSYWLLSLLAIAHEYSTLQLALGARFFALLFLDRGSPLIGQQYESQGVPDAYVIHPRREDPFEGWPEASPEHEPPYVRLPVASSWDPRQAAPVVFPIGDRPMIPADDALELAELLNRRGMERESEMAGESLGAIVLSAKIRKQAGIFPNGEPLRDDWESEDFELTEHQLHLLSDLLASESWPKSRPWFEHFQYEVSRHTGQASD